MKIIVTGSLGHISKPLATELVQQGHEVTVISSKPEKQTEIEILGAKAAIGSIKDVDFLTSTFTGADAVYCMEPPGSFFDPNFDIMAEIQTICEAYTEAILKSGVKRVIHLSSIGAHTDEGNGILKFHHAAEQIFGSLPSDISIIFMRPVGFYYNLFSFIPVIKSQGIIAANYGVEKKPWVSPLDIAATIAEEIVKPFEGRRIRYIASDELTGSEVATILGGAIGNPDLKWVVISDEQALNGTLAIGINPKIAEGLVEMNAGRRNHILYEDFYQHRPEMGKVKMKDFAKEFATVYNQNN
ncbi:MAG TPA: NAD(P)H-binding protein [Mucilaginibacter sp.]|nr:NAD(P)H-binding protein [Mucilaginibacter sp.]